MQRAGREATELPMSNASAWGRLPRPPVPMPSSIQSGSQHSLPAPWYATGFTHVYDARLAALLCRRRLQHPHLRVKRQPPLHVQPVATKVAARYELAKHHQAQCGGGGAWGLQNVGNQQEVMACRLAPHPHMLLRADPAGCSLTPTWRQRVVHPARASHAAPPAAPQQPRHAGARPRRRGAAAGAASSERRAELCGAALQAGRVGAGRVFEGVLVYATWKGCGRLNGDVT